MARTATTVKKKVAASAAKRGASAKAITKKKAKKPNGDEAPKSGKAKKVKTSAVIDPADFPGLPTDMTKSLDFRTTVRKLVDHVLQHQHILMAALHVIQTKRLYKKWKFDSFGDYVNQELQFEKRKAETFGKIYNILCIEAGHKAELMDGVGWAKLDILTTGYKNDLITKKGLKTWAAKAKDMTLKDVKAHFTALRQKKNPSDGPKNSVKIGITLIDDQATNWVACEEGVSARQGSEATLGQMMDALMGEFLSSSGSGSVEDSVNNLGRAHPGVLIVAVESKKEIELTSAFLEALEAKKIKGQSKKKKPKLFSNLSEEGEEEEEELTEDEEVEETEETEEEVDEEETDETEEEESDEEVEEDEEGEDEEGEELEEGDEEEEELEEDEE